MNTVFPDFKKIADLYSSIDGIDISFENTKSGDRDVNVFVFFGSQSELLFFLEGLEQGYDQPELREYLEGQISAGQPVCVYSALSRESSGDTFFSTIFIENSDVSLDCFAEELLQTLGLTGEFNDEIQSILNVDPNIKKPTKLDLEMLRVLYSPEMIAGAPVSEDVFKKLTQ